MERKSIWEIDLDFQRQVEFNIAYSNATTNAWLKGIPANRVRFPIKTQAAGSFVSYIPCVDTPNIKDTRFIFE